ncbi:MAG: vanadium-dependent haloperoxidase, partial [Actinobacteria bacterium]|nr:vanadium-dependent haloperoxidase [Actinomycetota bacterium]
GGEYPAWSTMATCALVLQSTTESAGIVDGTDGVPDAGPPPVLTHLGGIEPLVLPHADVFRPQGPPPLTSDRYARDLDEVATRGRLGAPRSPAEVATLRLWADHGVPQWNRVLLRLIDERALNLFEAARLLAMAHASGGDAMIACFEAKYHYRFWRPVHAIRRAGADGNDTTQSDPTWASQLPTPNHPEYPAAHSCHSTAIATAIGAFFGRDDVAITVDSQATGVNRRFDRLSDAVADVIEARILGGVHFRFSGEDGTTLGARVASFVTRTTFTQQAR